MFLAKSDASLKKAPLAKSLKGSDSSKKLSKKDFKNKLSLDDQGNEKDDIVSKFDEDDNEDDGQLNEEIDDEEEPDGEDDTSDEEILDEDLEGEDDASDGDEEISDEEEPESIKSPPPKKGKFPLKTRGDVATQEGRAVFIRNLGYSVTDKELAIEFAKFGEIELAITCKFPDTGRSTGTAFIHFKTKDSADECLDKLNSLEGIIISDRRVFGYRAVSREDAKAFKAKEKEPKDKRNLKLLRVSLVRPGTSAANNMSEFDVKKRQKLANLAKTKLKNLHMFVSPTRLAVRFRIY